MTRMPENIETQEDLEQAVKGLMERAKTLTDLAGLYGFVLTINTSPKQPLSMGNYEMQCELRVSHDVYRSAS